jgi:hypothetical protein
MGRHGGSCQWEITPTEDSNIVQNFGKAFCGEAAVLIPGRLNKCTIRNSLRYHIVLQC